MLHDDSILWDIVKIPVSLLLLLIVIGFIDCAGNATTSYKWNNGICPTCEVRYELRGITNRSKVYACPKCGQEVTRY